MSRTADQLQALLGFYKPNVGHGNFQPDVYNRGRNAMLVDVAVRLGLCDEDEIKRRMRVLDDEAYRRSEAAIERFNRRDAAARAALPRKDHDA